MEAGLEDLLFQGRNCLGVERSCFDCWQRILPKQHLFRGFWPEVAGAWTEIAVRELEPCTRERIGKRTRVTEKPARDFFVRGIEAERVDWALSMTREPAWAEKGHLDMGSFLGV
jgi:hypothetical protein